MRLLLALLLLGLLLGCATSGTRVTKTTHHPDVPMVYPLGLTMSADKQTAGEALFIPLLVEETRQADRITGVRIAPTGDIRAISPQADEIAFRWKLEACNATTSQAGYTLSLQLTRVIYPCTLTKSTTTPRGTATENLPMFGSRAYARVIVGKSPEGRFSISLHNDCISGCNSRLLVPEPLLTTPDCVNKRASR